MYSPCCMDCYAVSTALIVVSEMGGGGEGAQFEVNDLRKGTEECTITHKTLHGLVVLG